MQFIAIVVLSIIAACAYGIVHDQITARICVEYFTIGHPPVFGTDSPTLLGLGWGIIATWWVGLILGVPLACAARCGARPALSARELLRPLLVLLSCMSGVALLAGLVGHFAATSSIVFLVEPLASLVPKERHIAFLTDLWAHLASYGSGLVGGLILIGLTWRRRKITI
jgi:predicted outer membrane lipoprotein